MKTLVALSAAALMVGWVSAASPTDAVATKPIERVVANFTADVMMVNYLVPLDESLLALGNVRVTVNAIDRTDEDYQEHSWSRDEGTTGTITLTWGPESGFMAGRTESYAVLNLTVDGNRARVVADTGSWPFNSFDFTDGGAPGSEIVGTPNALGFADTRDALTWSSNLHSWSPDFIAYLRSGNVLVTGGG